MAEQRVVGRPVNVTGSPADSGRRGVSDTEAPAPRRGRKALVVLAVLVLALVGVAAYLLLRPSDAGAVDTAPEPGVVVPIDPVSVNLADGHYLRLGFSVQMTADAHGEISTARALDVAIAHYSGRTMAEVNDTARRAELKTELVTLLAETFEEEVMDVYLTDFVTQ
ncbi:flagellar basal body-associated FliL family protein [Georgenia subflava]|uniref:Flagellar protein FliL n=1 Tax=Georgenia subflava TaxID=1622177 RepID=A0A6N7EKU6_9MICO|nr:flagellar basal body-associated FliL family protein [Georgenia subflava]MPV39002.1 flagellar basal body rod protein [Georgenia subflava]